MTPRISDKPLYRLTIPELSGGVNFRDGISLVNDNQLTDCSNVWYKNGLLRTRPGVKCLKENQEFENDCVAMSEVRAKRIYAKRENYIVRDSVTYFLCVLQFADRLSFRYYSEDGECLKVADILREELPKVDYTCNVFQHNADIYCFCSGYYEDESIPYYIFKISEDKAAESGFTVKRITDELPEEEGGFHVPLIIMNGLTTAGTTPYDVSANTVFRGDYIEGYNLLGKRYKMTYSTVNKELFTGADETYRQPAVYELIHPVTEGSKVTVKVALPSLTNGNLKFFTHEVTVENPDEWSYEKWEEATPPEDGIYIGVSGRTLQFNNCQDKERKTFEKTDYIDANNLEIIAPCPNSKENYEKVLNMTFCEWFGGGSEGLYGGIHLFIGGNSSEKEKSLVCWSDLNRPLFFSENAYAYVGDTSQRVTAFGKQGEALVVFKERETYATQYVSNSSAITADAISTQAVVDVAANEVMFPMVQVHGFIGCDCPKSVQLCRNRLVWAHSDGKIYTLVSANQWTERSIFEISAMVERKLKNEGAQNLQRSLSADWEGHYVLSVGEHFYLCDYNSYGYSSVYSYSKNDDAQTHIPWWLWDKPKYNLMAFYSSDKVEERRSEAVETPIETGAMLTVGNRLYIWAWLVSRIDEIGEFYTPELIRFEGERDILPEITVSTDGLGELFRDRVVDDGGKEIPAMAQTKLFDFGGPTTQKKVPKAEISLGNNGGAPIRVLTLTDKGQDEMSITLDGEETDETQPKYFESVVIRNRQKINNRIGYRLESTGGLFVDALSVFYKQLGGAK